MKAPETIAGVPPALSRFSIVAGWLVMALGLAGLSGWLFDTAAIRHLVPGLPTMKANTALAFTLAGLAVWLPAMGDPSRLRRTIAECCAGLVALIGSFTLAEYAAGRDFGIDQWLFREPATPGDAHPGRMAVPTALNFALLGAAILLMWRGRSRPAIGLALAAILPTYVALAGCVYGAAPLQTSMAIHTAVAFLVLSAVLVSAQRDIGPMAILRSERPAGVLARRLLLAAFCLPLLLGWMRIVGERAGLYRTEVGLALVVVSNVAILGTLILWNARSLLKLDAMRRAAETKERQTADQLRVAAVAGNVGLWVWDLPTNEVYFSSVWKAQLGYAENEIPHRFDEWEKRLHPDDHERTLSTLHRYLAQPWPDFEYDFRLRHKDGSYRWILARADTLLDASGKILRMTGCHIDVTERKLAEEELSRALAELQRSNAELAQFAYIASHDLQEPLRAVTGCVQLLAKHYKGKLDERADELIHHSVDGVARMQALIQDLLAYSRLQSQKSPLAETDCGKSLEIALANLSTTIRERDAVITHDPLPVLLADRTQMVQLFQNLISNSLKFCTDRRPEIHIGVRAGVGESIFSVRDNGIGIDPKYHERIFEIFQRLHTRAEYPGTGIGLAICKRIVECHGGRIWVESQPGRGTTFSFAIPNLE
jgi:PAS domain S-box-containing protein